MPEESTTPDLVELGRGLFEAANRRDFDAILLRYAPNALWDMNPLGGLGTFEAHAAIRGFWEDWYASYEDLEIEAEEALDFGNGVQGWFDSYPDLHVEPLEIRANGDRVFVWTRFTGHGADSGVPMEIELAHVFTMEDGRTRRLEEYFDRAEALRAVGMEE